MKKIAGILAAMAVLTALFLPGTAYAIPVQTAKTLCDGPGGNGWIDVRDSAGHILGKVRNCTITWYHDLDNDSYGQMVDFDLADEYKDGYSAIALAEWFVQAPGRCTTNGKGYCADGDGWSHYQISLSGRSPSNQIMFSVAWGPASSGPIALRSKWATVISPAPAGF
ncbi:hypothetical protein Afil01_24300 [Actinorhabdospora filicis]|uniref:Secreted protein n=1 Tax=Actinorhabdospora filicis TaxID=1785913 RepID=A0A9W6SKF7_9ACTN|nr:hypothetical protein [Actinorhabdospora filicis]GLZ77623.1 hypothetical protein Afil01_24300 [Actinorhabdospora filicis]